MLQIDVRTDGQILLLQYIVIRPDSRSTPDIRQDTGYPALAISQYSVSGQQINRPNPNKKRQKGLAPF